MGENIKKYVKKYFKSNVAFSIFCLLFLSFIFLRSYQPEVKSPFGYDQVDNAWTAKNIIVDHRLPLVGMQAKGNTGFYIGPYYYYFLVPFYLITSLDPIASNLVAVVTAIITFLVIYFVTRSIFNEKVALFALFINSFSSYILELDRVQWPASFITPISFLFFYCLHKLILGKYQYLIMLTVVFGFSLHIHFTSIFYIIFFLLSLTLIPKRRKLLKYILHSIPILALFTWPIIFNLIVTNNGSNVSLYIEENFHGFHLRRFIQIAGDGLIEFNSILKFPYAIFCSLAAITFYIVSIHKNRILHEKSLLVLPIIWILVPWLSFSTYSGELTNYYFSVTRPIAILVFAYLICNFFFLRPPYTKIVVILILLIYAFDNVSHFLNTGPVGLKKHRKDVLEKIGKGEKIEFVQGDPQSFLNYYYAHQKYDK